MVALVGAQRNLAVRLKHPGSGRPGAASILPAFLSAPWDGGPEGTLDRVVRRRIRSQPQRPHGDLDQCELHAEVRR
eukprot:4952940-Pyramimonas_sp.AAC.1